MDPLDLPNTAPWLFWMCNHRWLIFAVVVVILALVIAERVRRFQRRHSQPAALNPRLAKYGGKSAAEAEADRKNAEKIVATSSTSSVAGYDLVRQIEAVFVEG